MRLNDPDVILNILLADDDIDDRFFFNKALKSINILSDLKSVADGEQLMKYLRDHADDLPDLLFLDMNMPRKNGLECLLEIKKDPLFKKIPVIVYSTSLREEIGDILYQNGAHYYIKKCSFEELTESIKRILSLLKADPHQPSRDTFILILQEL